MYSFTSSIPSDGNYAAGNATYTTVFTPLVTSKLLLFMYPLLYFYVPVLSNVYFNLCLIIWFEHLFIIYFFIIIVIVIYNDDFWLHTLLDRLRSDYSGRTRLCFVLFSIFMQANTYVYIDPHTFLSSGAVYYRCVPS